jgi:hypothetical protein
MLVGCGSRDGFVVYNGVLVFVAVLPVSSCASSSVVW